MTETTIWLRRRRRSRRRQRWWRLERWTPSWRPCWSCWFRWDPRRGRIVSFRRKKEGGTINQHCVTDSDTMWMKFTLVTIFVGCTIFSDEAKAQLVDNFVCPDEFEGYYPHLYSCDRYGTFVFCFFTKCVSVTLFFWYFFVLTRKYGYFAFILREDCVSLFCVSNDLNCSDICQKWNTSVKWCSNKTRKIHDS